MCVVSWGGIISQSGSFIGVMHELELFGASCWQGLLGAACCWRMLCYGEGVAQVRTKEELVEKAL